MYKGKDNLIWLGAGLASSSLVSFTDFARVILVDAREKCCKSLVKKFKGENIKVVNMAVSDKRKEQALNIYSVETFSALTKATGLYDLYPGIKHRKNIIVSTCKVSEFVAQQTSPQSNNTLIVDIPDQADAILKMLLADNLIDRFSQIAVCISKFSLYEGNKDNGQLAARILSDNHFKPTMVDNSDPDLPLQMFEIDAVQKKLAEIEKNIVNLSSSTDRSLTINKKLASVLDNERRMRIDLEDELEKVRYSYGQLVNESAKLKGQIDFLEELLLQESN